MTDHTTIGLARAQDNLINQISVGPGAALEGRDNRVIFFSRGLPAASVVPHVVLRPEALRSNTLLRPTSPRTDSGAKIVPGVHTSRERDFRRPERFARFVVFFIIPNRLHSPCSPFFFSCSLVFPPSFGQISEPYPGFWTLRLSHHTRLMQLSNPGASEKSIILSDPRCTLPLIRNSLLAAILRVVHCNTSSLAPFRDSTKINTQLLSANRRHSGRYYMSRAQAAGHSAGVKPHRQSNCGELRENEKANTIAPENRVVRPRLTIVLIFGSG